MPVYGCSLVDVIDPLFADFAERHDLFGSIKMLAA
jgi:hypothetical protein